MKNLRLTLFLLAFAGLGLAFSGCSPKGCTDPTADNYDPDAKKDDGSCSYDGGFTGVVTITDDGSGIGTTTWTKDKIYLLDGFCFVNDGQTLTIEPGTVIKGKAGAGADASALIVARGGTLLAEGTASEPIIFTAATDKISDPNDIPAGTNGLWGGLIVLGKAILNSAPGETAIEGIPTSEPRGLYGGSDDTDNSGKLSYISIRYGGTDIGAGNEINGLTLGGVGSGTTINHIEIFSNADDGMEIFGGAPQIKYIVSAFCGDDGFDYDEGFRGKGQFWLAVQGAVGDRGGEHDGGTSPEDGTPYAHPVIYNATYIGRGAAQGTRACTFRDNAGGEYHNSIWVEYAKGIDIENLASGEDSYNRFNAGTLVLENNVFYNVAGNVADDIFKIEGPGSDATDSLAAVAALKNYFSSASNSVADPGISVTRTGTDGGISSFNPIPSNTMSATSATDTWYDAAAYKGAFGTTNWLLGWTALDELGLVE
ncbi:MAG: hypothetical protein H6581_06280 [Bacteroidia bacterium]|nr:hypothetical protein [Bacteroidia bacterium]